MYKRCVKKLQCLEILKLKNGSLTKFHKNLILLEDDFVRKLIKYRSLVWFLLVKKITNFLLITKMMMMIINIMLARTSA